MAKESGYGQTIMNTLVIVAVIYALYKALDALGLIPSLNYSFDLSGLQLGSPGDVEYGQKAYAAQAGYEQNVDKQSGQAAVLTNVYLSKNEYAGIVKDETTTDSGTPIVEISSPRTIENYWNFKNLYTTKNGQPL